MAIDSSSLGWAIAFPPEDYRLSPSTGFTRAHWEVAADNLLLAVRRFRSPGGGQIDLPGHPSHAGSRSDGLEGFARTFLLAAFRVAGEHGADPHGLFTEYLHGLASGTRGIASGESAVPGETWQPIGDAGAGGQPMVESACIALGLHLTRRWSWELLDHRQRADVEAWLRGALHHKPAANNWQLFPLTVANFLESVGHGDTATRAPIERALDLLERWYRGDGWYSDGEGRAFDHYGGWALHFFPVLFACLRVTDSAGSEFDSSENAELLARFRDRLRSFLESFILTFDRNGSPLYQGRSLTYRMATGASVALGEVVGSSPLRPGQSRRLLSSTLRYFLERGSVANGLFSRGWHGEHAASVQSYSGPASPYWASVGFLGLALPREHPLWTSQEEPLDDDDVDTTRGLPSVGWLIQRTGRDGVARVHNHGSDHTGVGDDGDSDPLYARLAYSTRTGATALHNVTDNDVQVTVDGVPSTRRQIHPLGTGDDWAASFHVPRFPTTASGNPMPSIAHQELPPGRIESLVIARGAWEVRVNRFRNIPSGLPVRVSGWALAVESPEECQQSVTSDPDDGAGPRLQVRLATCEISSDLVALRGWTAAAAGRAPQGTAYGRFAIVPELTAISGPGFYVAAARVATPDYGAPEDFAYRDGAAQERDPKQGTKKYSAPAGSAPPSVRVNGDELEVNWLAGIHRVVWDGDRPVITWQRSEGSVR